LQDELLGRKAPRKSEPTFRAGDLYIRQWLNELYAKNPRSFNIFLSLFVSVLAGDVLRR
jgi:hypothetical protein